MSERASNIIHASGRLTILGLVMMISACASTGVETDTELVWQSRNDYVRIEPREQLAEKSPNQHPASFSSEQIIALLRAIDVAQQPGQLEALIGTGDEPESIPVFTEKELQKLAEPLAKALAKAGADSDVLFAVSSLRFDEAFGLLGSTRSTTGRVFQRDDQLNLILGALHVDHRREIETRGHPYSGYVSKIDRKQQKLAKASRTVARHQGGAIVPKSGLSLASIEGEQRGDWAIISPEVLLAKAPRTIDEDEKTLPPPTETVDSVIEDEATSDDVETRLARLKELLDQGLIGEELYQEKSAAILEDL